MTIIWVDLDGTVAGLPRRRHRDVDAENPTGALGLYQSLGFTVAARSVSLVKRY
ncbi:hypothetical protein [Streptomyces sp. NPDC052042]|uniref:hypothetical protein n=1 Tax=Streptomyces sp. NPDC052042 TaxID=3365683 RepID=UPI0037D80A0D